jgi:hypothetical protein
MATLFAAYAQSRFWHKADIPRLATIVIGSENIHAGTGLSGAGFSRGQIMATRHNLRRPASISIAKDYAARRPQLTAPCLIRCHGS